MPPGARLSSQAVSAATSSALGLGREGRGPEPG